MLDYQAQHGHFLVVRLEPILLDESHASNFELVASRHDLINVFLLHQVVAALNHLLKRVLEQYEVRKDLVDDAGRDVFHVA